MSNVIPFSNRTAYLLQEIIDGHNMEKSSRIDWMAGVMKQALALAEAREAYPSNGAFSAWLSDNGAGFYNDDDRAAYIKLGKNPEAAQIALEETGRTSVQMIVREELPEIISRLRNATKMEETSETTSEEAETASISQEIVETEGEISGEESVLPAKAAKGGRAPKLSKNVGINEAEIIRGFMRAKSHGARLMLEKIAEKKGGKSAVREFAEALNTGKYGDGYDVGVSFLGPRAIFPELPENWSKDHKFISNTPAELRSFTANLDNLLALRDALEVDKPKKAYEYCCKWWHRNVESKLAGTQQVAGDYNPIEATAAALAARGVLLPTITDTGEYAECKAEERYIPIRDTVDIIVCGVTIYKAGSEPWDKFCKIAGAYEFWTMLDAGYKLSEPRVLQRGFEYRRLRGPLAWGDPVFAQVIWNIGNAMANHAEKFAETSGTHVRGAGG